MKIEWAPMKVPPKRRMQTLAAGLYVFLFFFLVFISLSTIAIALIFGNTFVRLLTVLYLTYIYYDHTVRWNYVAGNGWMWLRNNFIWKSLRDYFPVELVKTAELPPDHNYILASFPHGVLGTGITVNMSTDISHWLKVFPGVRPKIGTLHLHFRTPFLREMLKGIGFISVEKPCLINYLSKSNDPKHPENKDGFTSNAVAILVGGAQEALDAHPRHYEITLKPRKGFVKIAIRTGSPIVPSFSFGEVDIFDQLDNPPDSWLRRFQSLVKKLTGISPVMVMGRGFFQYSFGMLPQRRHIVQVVGAPIPVKKVSNPSQEYIDQIHARVITEVIDLFETHKWRYIENAKDVKLIIH